MIETTLLNELEAGDGLAGFGIQLLSNVLRYLELKFPPAPSVGPDADDTAKSLIALDLLNVHYSRSAMVKEYEAADHFKTYPLERNPSLSANCNVLSALLRCPNVDDYCQQIVKCCQFICNVWWTSNDMIQDKWVI
jgi:hypothetical protein